MTVNPDGTASIKKHFCLGRISHELVQVMPDERTVLMGDDATNSGYFDRYDDWHVAGTQEVALEHLGILRFYLFGKPLPTRNDGWHITWEIELDRQEGETPRDAAMMAGEIAIDQFMKLAGDFIGASVTKPALTINGQLIDFEHDQ